ncbi:MAG: hypothetical protein RQ885_11500 [Desulfurococcales archaeon]|nr:hypothetical protein [Desulfurococcales archaeon]
MLFDIGLACARLWNELSYEKRQAFFNRELSPGKRDEINKKYYHKYIRRFLVLMLVRLLIRMMRLGTLSTELLKLRKQGELLSFIRKVSPLGYWKDRLTGKKEIQILIRNDRYRVKPISKNEGYIVLEDFDLRKGMLAGSGGRVSREDLK